MALGRAIVRHPRVFLFDEPLSNLDAKLRVQMRVELKKLHLRLGTTAVYVTHDQVEAMTLGDRVVVMKDGLVQQVGEPLELYNQPANKFVAGFIGSPAMNFATVTMTGRQRPPDRQERRAWRSRCRRRTPTACARHVGQQMTLGIRPEDLHVASDADPAGLTFASKVEVVEQLGSEILLDVRVGDDTMVAAVDPTIARQGARSSCGSRSIRSGCTSSTPRPRRRSDRDLSSRSFASAKYPGPRSVHIWVPALGLPPSAGMTAIGGETGRAGAL